MCDMFQKNSKSSLFTVKTALALLLTEEWPKPTEVGKKGKSCSWKYLGERVAAQVKYLKSLSHGETLSDKKLGTAGFGLMVFS